ncbi:hypothetical protein CDAR_611251 [Caerostris darwini]|uniref:Uncharacterized protein n=1 Tax=Caerostris darwini TaxID=1538125 RepID=A0AAV4TBI9_9ARAC|nr:hypothetical protein CDAR_611251 [Caerostris darwini]
MNLIDRKFCSVNLLTGLYLIISPLQRVPFNHALVKYQISPLIAKWRQPSPSVPTSDSKADDNDLIKYRGDHFHQRLIRLHPFQGQGWGRNKFLFRNERQ